MLVGIIQSSYIPWRGYFDFIDDVDLFVFLDEVQFTRRSWRSRNRIKTQHGTQWLTVPVCFSRLGEKRRVQDVRIDYSRDWVRSHTRALHHAYCRSDFYKQHAPALMKILGQGHETISDLNVALTRWLMGKLSIDTPTLMSSNIEHSSCSRNGRLIQLLKGCGARAYLSGPSAESYLEPSCFTREGLEVYVKEYDYPPYPQLHGAFEGQVSVIDLLFNCGPQARAFLKSRVGPRSVVAAR